MLERLFPLRITSHLGFVCTVPVWTVAREVFACWIPCNRGEHVSCIPPFFRSLFVWFFWFFSSLWAFWTFWWVLARGGFKLQLPPLLQDRFSPVGTILQLGGHGCWQRSRGTLFMYHSTEPVIYAMNQRTAASTCEPKKVCHRTDCGTITHYPPAPRTTFKPTLFTFFSKETTAP